MTARETARNMIEALGLDPEAFASLRHGHFVRAERSMVHQLPWLWVDEATLTTLVRPPTTRRIQHRARRAWSPTMIVGASVGGVMTFVSAFGLIVLALGNQAFGSNWTHWLAMVIVIVAAVVVMALTMRPRLSLAMMSSRAVLMAVPREFGTIDAERAFVVVAPRREHSRTGNSTQIGIRWWFYLPGRRVVYVYDLVAAQIPWAEGLHKPAYTPAMTTERVSACRRCGYPTEGLRYRRCPECGARIG